MRRHGDEVGRWLIGTALVAAVLASVGAAPAVAGDLSVATALVSNSCGINEYSWMGNETLEHGESFTLADLLPTHERYSQEVTWIDVYPSTLSIRVGDTPATLGSPVYGGPITVTNNGAEALVAISVTVDIKSCDRLAGAFPPGGRVWLDTAVLEDWNSHARILERLEADLTEVGPLGLPRVLAAIGCVIAGFAMSASSRRRFL
jgi:hypothetical protein